MFPFSPKANGMGLAEFIRHNREPIIEEWESFARSLAPGAHMTRLQLRDHIEPILSFIARDIESPQSPAEQVSKSHGERDTPEARQDSAAEAHGTLRHDDGFDIVQMVSEYRALRSSIVRLWTRSKDALNADDLVELTRFNEAIDQALAESVVKFMRKVDYSKDLLLGVLGHDIRTPIGAMKMAGALLPRAGPLNGRQVALASQIGECATRVTRIVGDLLDLARARMGTRLPVTKAAMDMERVARQVIDEMRLLHPTRPLSLQATGQVQGEWDEARLGQMFSNLIGNAVQYGAENTPVDVGVHGDEDAVTISVHNAGEPIPASQLTTIFHSFTRGDRTAGANLGLGLFITQEIVASHGGTIRIVSSAAEGTTFIARIPR